MKKNNPNRKKVSISFYLLISFAIIMLVFLGFSSKFLVLNASSRPLIIENKLTAIEFENIADPDSFDSGGWYVPQGFSMPLSTFKGAVEPNQTTYLADINCNTSDTTYTLRVFSQISGDENSFTLNIGTDSNDIITLAQYVGTTATSPDFTWTYTNYGAFTFAWNSDLNFIITEYQGEGIYSNVLTFKNLLSTSINPSSQAEYYRTYVLAIDRQALNSNEIFNDGFGQGVLQGEEDVLTNLSGYGLITYDEASAYSYNQYQQGVLDGNSEALKYNNIFTNVFGALANVLSIEIFPGITLGLVIGFPLLFTLLIIALKIARG